MCIRDRANLYSLVQWNSFISLFISYTITFTWKNFSSWLLTITGKPSCVFIQVTNSIVWKQLIELLLSSICVTVDRYRKTAMNIHTQFQSQFCLYKIGGTEMLSHPVPSRSIFSFIVPSRPAELWYIPNGCVRPKLIDLGKLYRHMVKSMQYTNILNQ